MSKINQEPNWLDKLAEDTIKSASKKKAAAKTFADEAEFSVAISNFMSSVTSKLVYCSLGKKSYRGPDILNFNLL
jgi:AICAR transformylase/IMP cyclohydrolase PurH